MGLGASETAGGTADAVGHQSYAQATVGHGELVVANDKGIYKVTNGGRTWTNITPPGIGLFSHIFKIVIYGHERIWLEMDGDFRFDFIPYSWDGGVTWQTADLPDGANNPQSLRFTSPSDGRVIAYASSSSTTQSDNEKLTLQTVDGGATWVRTADGE
jgi:photosystem II stability/assembly factor-like uncharacterized protein